MICGDDDSQSSRAFLPLSSELSTMRSGLLSHFLFCPPLLGHHVASVLGGLTAPLPLWSVKPRTNITFHETIAVVLALVIHPAAGGLIGNVAPSEADTPNMYVRAEGVLYAEKDFNLDQHPEIEGVPNLQVIKLMQSFVSKELVTERFAWRHYYWYELASVRTF